jgi:hypothetical protein
VLEWGDLELTRLSGMNGLRRLVSSATYRASFIESLGKTGVYWEQCVQLARVTPVWVLRRPRDWAAMEAAVGLIARQWQPMESDSFVHPASKTGKGAGKPLWISDWKSKRS